MSLAPGTRLGPYQIATPIGAGGMGEVYRAHDTRLGRDVAIKALPDAFSSDPDRLARFEREAKVLASLNHANLAAIYGVEEVDGRRYLILEYVEGETLAARLGRGQLSIEDTIQICRQIASGMEAAHEAGVVHRDMKPGNVMITPGDQVKVVDFGLAKGKAAEPEEISPDYPTSTDSPALRQSPVVGSPGTLPGTILGTAAYLSPEQARGKVVDRRADIWSFGCVLYECLTGRRAFEGETVSDLIAGILAREPDWGLLPVGTPTRLRELLGRCLEKDPKGRLRDIGEARLALEGLKGWAGTASGEARRRKGLTSRFLPLAAAVLLVALGTWLWKEIGPGRSRAPGAPVAPFARPTGVESTSASMPSIAVLAFEDLSPGKDQEYFADGVSEELISVLARIRDLRVVSRTSAFSFKGKNADLATVAQQLNVAMVLEGSVRKVGNRLRITAQLIQVSTDSHLWSRTYDREFKDILAVQNDIAQSVVSEIRTTLSAGQPGALDRLSAEDEAALAARGRGNDAGAYTLYLEGRFFEGRRTLADVAKGIERYRQAVTREPGFALAWASLSRATSYQATNNWVEWSEGDSSARKSAERAVLLDPSLAEAHLALFGVKLFHAWDWVAAEKSMRRALGLAPGNAEVVRAAAELASYQGRVEEAVVLGRRAVALDPLSVPTLTYLGMFSYNAGLLDDATAAWEKALEISPDQDAIHAGLALVRLAQGRADEALTEAMREPDEMWRLWALAMVHHPAGRRAESDASLKRLIEKYARGCAFQIADVYAFRGEADRAFEWLERAYEQRDAGVLQIKPDPRLRSLHPDPRWGLFLKKIGLSE